jgi:hypothetical protein
LNNAESVLAKAIVLVLAVLASASFILSVIQALASNNNKLSSAIRIAAAKCPGIPGGSGSGGPDYINIGIDVGLFALFGFFVFLTVRDVYRKKRSASEQTETS